LKKKREKRGKEIGGFLIIAFVGVNGKRERYAGRGCLNVGPRGGVFGGKGGKRKGKGRGFSRRFFISRGEERKRKGEKRRVAHFQVFKRGRKVAPPPFYRRRREKKGKKKRRRKERYSFL